MPTIDLSFLPELHWLTPEVHLHLTADPVGLFPSWLAGIAIFLAVVTVPYQAITGLFGNQQEPLNDNGAVTEVVPGAEQAPDLTSIAAVEPGSTIPLDMLFAGGENSIVSRTVGHAEGTRTAMGERTKAYYGHVDPGNGVWNLGSFSYQHGANSPEEADKKQLRRLQRQAQQLREKATSRNIALGLEAELNGIDLANQAPEAALGKGGYIDRLAEAYSRGLAGADAVLWARTWSYLDPNTGQWNAPGLGNTLWSIRDDQERRRQAIAEALNFTPVKATLATNTAPPEAAAVLENLDPESGPRPAEDMA